jgi:hypothetical protein
MLYLEKKNEVTADWFTPYTEYCITKHAITGFKKFMDNREIAQQPSSNCNMQLRIIMAEASNGFF